MAMDMWAAFENAATELLPNADIVHDKFHVSAHLNKAVDNVRKEEHRELMSAGDDTLKKSKYLWLRNFPDLRCEPSFQELYNANLKTSKAWRFKEAFTAFWDYIYQVPAEKFFRHWWRSVKRSKLEPLKKVADMPHLGQDHTRYRLNLRQRSCIRDNGLTQSIPMSRGQTFY